MQETTSLKFLLSLSTSGASVAAAGTHPSSAGRPVCVLVRVQGRVCAGPTHSAQKQQHAAHHNGHHNGQLAAAELHFGDHVAKVPHLHLQRERRVSHKTGSRLLKRSLLFYQN